MVTLRQENADDSWKIYTVVDNTTTYEFVYIMSVVVTDLHVTNITPEICRANVCCGKCKKIQKLQNNVRIKLSKGSVFAHVDVGNFRY